MKRFALFALLLSAWPTTARADLIHFYYVGVDTRTTIPSGTFTGLPDPNYHRLTFLYGHQDTANPPGNHYHAKGSYSYTGPNLGAGTAVNPYNGTPGVSNVVRDAGIFQLLPGTGSLEGKFVSGIDPADISDNTVLRSVDVLSGAPANSMDWYQFHSASDRWTTSLAGTNLQLKLTSITNGLEVVDANGNVLFDSAGDTFNLGAGDSMSFAPIFATSTPGFTGSATFILTDLNGLYGDSGQFVYSVAAVPEPSSMLLLGALALGVGTPAGVRRWRTRSA